MKIAALLCFTSFLFCLAAPASRLSPRSSSVSPLDELLEAIADDSTFDPFTIGETAAAHSKHYLDLLVFAKNHGVKVQWVSSVAESVLQLPFLKDRYKIKADAALDGWFDEYCSPNLIFIARDASLATLIHELRHALQLGTHGLMEGNWFDQRIQQNKKRITEFQLRFAKSALPEKLKGVLKKASTRMIETASEISAHEGDLLLARRFQRLEAPAYQRFINEYKREFQRNYEVLNSSETSKTEFFIQDLKQLLETAVF